MNNTSNSPTTTPSGATTALTSTTTTTIQKSYDKLQHNVKIRVDGDGNTLQVFLGGSCNPTTWRRTVAIPFLEMNGITYYNPQIDNWTPEVVNLERYAKQNAKVLLFVIDRQTRSTVSIIESAFMAGEKKNLVVVIYPLKFSILSPDEQSQTNIESKRQTTTKTTSSSRGFSLHRQNKKTVVESSTSSSMLISSTSQYSSNMNSEIESESKTTTLKSCKISTSKIQDQHSLKQKLHEANESLRMSNELISANEFNELKQARQILHTLIAYQKIPIFDDILQGLKYLSYYLRNCDDKNSSTSNRLKDKPTKATSTDHPSYPLESPANHSLIGGHDHNSSDQAQEGMKDIYLSLDSEDHASLEAIVLPILDEKGLTYNYMTVNNSLGLNTQDLPSSREGTQNEVPGNSLLNSEYHLSCNMPASDERQISLHSDQCSTTTTTTTSNSELCQRTRLALEREICAIKSSRILLFVITNKCRGLSIMVIASHFMALYSENVVLCLQYLEKPCSIGGETLTETAIADYNRGRVYLSDYAVKSQIPVFSTIQDAIECCSRKCRYNYNKI